MILELVAGRIIAPYVGVSLYTWTSVIGVILAGLTLGNFVGGRLADRWPSPKLLGVVYLVAGLLSLVILSIDGTHRALAINELIEGEQHVVIPILFLTGALFFLPAAALGAISPIIVKLTVRDLARTGSTVGRIYGFGSIGSIAGTFATGFWLISRFGTHRIVLGVAVVLLFLGVLFLIGKRWPWLLVAAAVLGAGMWQATARGWLDGPCSVETNYFCIRVREEEKRGQLVRVLVLDRLVHSYSSLTDPTHLVYGYERGYAAATAYQADQTGGDPSALFIGGGGYTFPRYTEAVFPESVVTVIEIDPWVTEVAHQTLGLPRDTQIATHNEDARVFLERTPDRGYDLVFGDAFNDFSVPYHLTTKEFNDRVHAWLAADGLYIVNVIDGGTGPFLRPYVHTMHQTFAYVYLAPTSESWRELAHNTFVVIGTDAPLDRDALRRIDAEDGTLDLVDYVLADDELIAWLAEVTPVTLTDRFAPVDQLLTAVFRGEAPGD